jgi:hypothetical protein
MSSSPDNSSLGCSCPSSTMRQTDFGPRIVAKRALTSKLHFEIAILQAQPTEILSILGQRALRTLRDRDCQSLRTRHIASSNFNFNSYSDQSCLRDFRFCRKDVPRLVDVIGWVSGRTRRNRYKCEPLVAICILLRRLAYPCRWSDLEVVFGKHASALSEIYWEVAENLVERRGKLITKFRRELLRSRSELYSNAIENCGAPLDSCVGLIDCTKIAVARPGGRTSNQRAIYSGHK